MVFMNNKTQISFIIPAYNAEDTIESCVNSILNIKRKDLEVVVIDDGSTDFTFKICEQIEDERVRVIRKRNGGVSTARNTGIIESTGKFIIFCDADDQIETKEMEQILSDINDSDELIMFQVRRVVNGVAKSEKSGISTGIYGKEMLQRLSMRLLDMPIYRNKSNNYLQGSACFYIYRRETIIKNNILFRDNLRYAEDLCFCLEIFKKFNHIKVTNNCGYIINVRENSASRGLRRQFWRELKEVYQVIVEITGTENEILYCHFGRAAVNHYLLHMPIKEWQSAVGEVLEDYPFKTSLKEISFPKKTLLEKVFDSSCIHKYYIGFVVYVLCQKIYFKANEMIERIRV